MEGRRDAALVAQEAADFLSAEPEDIGDHAHPRRLTAPACAEADRDVATESGRNLDGGLDGAIL